MTPVDPDKLGTDLSAYLDGALDPQRTREIEELLRRSPAARAALDDLRRVPQRLGELPRLRCPENLAAAFEDAARERAPAVRASRRPYLIRIATRVSASAALIFLGLAAGWALFTRPVGSQTATQRTSDAIARRETSRGAPGAITAPPPSERVPEGVAVARGPTAPQPAPLAAGPPSAPPKPSAARARRGTPPAAGMLAGAGRTETGSAGRIVRAAPVHKPAPAEEKSRQAQAPPIVHVVVAPADAQTYAAVLDDVATWDSSGQAACKRWSDQKPRVRDLTVQIPPDRVGLILAQLNEHAPQQVRATMQLGPDSFSAARTAMLTAGPAAVAPDAVQEAATRRDRPGSSTAVQAASRRKAPRGGRAAPASRRQATASPSPAQPETTRPNKVRTAQTAPAVSRLARGDEQAARPGRPAGDERAEWVERLTRPWERMYDSLLGLVFRGQRPVPQEPQAARGVPALAPIPVRITILPPPTAGHAPASRESAQSRPVPRRED